MKPPPVELIAATLINVLLDQLRNANFSMQHLPLDPPCCIRIELPAKEYVMNFSYEHNEIVQQAIKLLLRYGYQLCNSLVDVSRTL